MSDADAAAAAASPPPPSSQTVQSHVQSQQVQSQHIQSSQQSHRDLLLDRFSRRLNRALGDLAGRDIRDVRDSSSSSSNANNALIQLSGRLAGASRLRSLAAAAAGVEKLPGISAGISSGISSFSGISGSINGSISGIGSSSSGAGRFRAAGGGGGGGQGQASRGGQQAHQQRQEYEDQGQDDVEFDVFELLHAGEDSALFTMSNSAPAFSHLDREDELLLMFGTSAAAMAAAQADVSDFEQDFSAIALAPGGSDMAARCRRELSRRIARFVESSDNAVAGLTAIHVLLDSGYLDDDKTHSFANIIVHVPLSSSRDRRVIRLAARAFGKLVKIGQHSVTTEMVDHELTNALRLFRSSALAAARGRSGSSTNISGSGGGGSSALGSASPDASPLASSSGGTIIGGLGLGSSGGSGGWARRYACLLELKELAINAPTLFNTHIGSFVDRIWDPLRDQSEDVRLAAVDALRACLVVIAEREHTMRLQWYGTLIDEALRELVSHSSHKDAKAPGIQSALLVLGELLANSGDFMDRHFDGVAAEAIKYRDSKQPAVRAALIDVFPLLAAYSPSQFAKIYLNTAMKFLLSFRRDSKKDDALLFGRALLSVGRVAAAVGGGVIVPFLEQTMAMITSGLGPPVKKKRETSVATESMRCLSLVVGAVGSGMRAHVQGCLSDLFATGLTLTLSSTLATVARRIPAMETDIHERLLNCISEELGYNASVVQDLGASEMRRRMQLPHSTSALLPGAGVIPGKNAIGVIQVLQEQDPLRTARALHVLGSFPFWSPNNVRQGFSEYIAQLLRECVVHFLSSDDFRVRKRAAIACARLLPGPLDRSSVLRRTSTDRRLSDEKRPVPSNNLLSAIRLASGSTSMSKLSYKSSAASMAEIVEPLIRIGVTDPDPGIRQVIFSSLGSDPRFYESLSQTHNLRSLFMALNDEQFVVRELAIAIIGRLALCDPAYVLPSLRKLLIQLLGDIQYGGVGRNREQSARLLAHLLRTASSVVKPYVESLLRVLLPRVASQDNPRFASHVLAALGDLTAAAGTQMTPHLPYLIPHIVDILEQGQSTPSHVYIGGEGRRQVALRALAQLTVSSGYVMEPYFDYPHLLPTLIRLLSVMSRGEHGAAVRGAGTAVVRVFGVLGAVAPFSAKRILDGTGQRGSRRVSALSDSMALESSDTSRVTVVSESSQDIYFPTVTIHALCRILNDRALGNLYRSVVERLTAILKPLGSTADFAVLIPVVLRPVLNILRRSDIELRSFLFRQLGLFISYSSSPMYVREFFDDILDLILFNWNSSPSMIPTLCILLRDISSNIGGEFGTFLPRLIQPMLQIMRFDNSPDRDNTREVLRSLEVFGPLLDDYMHIVSPAIVRLFEDEQVRLTSSGVLALRTLRQLSIHLKLGDYASRIIHPVVRLIDSLSSPSFSASDSSVKQAARNMISESFELLCALVIQLGSDYAMFVSMVNKVLAKYSLAHQKYDDLIARLMKNHPLVDAIAVVNSSTNTATEENTGILPGGKDSTTASALTPSKTEPTLREDELKLVWRTAQRVTREDWGDWIRRLAMAFLQQSPRASLRSAAPLAQQHYPLLRELFNPGFISCWRCLGAQSRQDLVRNLEHALQSPALPADVLQTLLNLAEFMEHEDEALPLDVRNLAQLAERSRAFAKALHYKEEELERILQTPGNSRRKRHDLRRAIGDTIALNNQLDLHDAALGLLDVARKHLPAHRNDSDADDTLDLDASWYEELHDWESALSLHEQKRNISGQVRCLHALGEWDRVAQLSLSTLNALERRSDSPANASLSLSDSSGVEPSNSLEITLSGNQAEQQSTPRRRKSSHTRSKSKRSNREGKSSKQALEDLLQDIAPLAADAFWRLEQWSDMETFVDVLPDPFVGDMRVHDGDASSENIFFRAVLAVQRQDRPKAQALVDLALNQLEAELPALLAESYARAYARIVRAQQVVELEEILQATLGLSLLTPRLDNDLNEEFIAEQHSLLRQVWSKRLKGSDRSIEVWQQLLGVRTLMWSVKQDPEPTLKFVRLCRRRGNNRLALSTLVQLLEIDPEAIHTDDGDASRAGWSLTIPPSCDPRISLEYLSHQWAIAADLGKDVERDSRQHSILDAMKSLPPLVSESDSRTRARVYHRIGDWELELANDLSPGSESAKIVTNNFQAAVASDGQWYTAWHSWALANFRMLSHVDSTERADRGIKKQELAVAAIEGFFRSCSLRPNRNLQDTLRLLTLWFKFGGTKAAKRALVRGLDTVPISTWIQVIPQLIARITSPDKAVRRLVIRTLVSLGKEHAQALLFPLTVCLKADDPARVKGAALVTDSIRKHSPELLSEALLVADELVRVSILWHETWYYALEDASRLHFREKSPERAVARLAPLHKSFEADTADRANQLTHMEESFFAAFARDLQDAAEWTKRYQQTKSDADIDQAWDIYYGLFRRLQKWLAETRRLELRFVSPRLLAQTNLRLAVPGTSFGAITTIGQEKDQAPTIQSFHRSLDIFQTKQRPRKMTMIGSDGVEYGFLLKGHEDLRQDERVMQLFGLVNSLLSSGWATSRQGLSIQRYSVVPISPNSGLIGWVPRCDTLQSLISSYREARHIPVLQEQGLLMQASKGDFKALTIIQKVELFGDVLHSTDGQDLRKILSLQSHTSEVWLERRTMYTRSLAVMSMVGHVLGLGDRHCSNLMIQRETGKVVHIDFGDCFEVAQKRASFPERMPFRLTRMLVDAMGIGGLEGTFTRTCQAVMTTMRENDESLMAVLEAFVYDPLISWRLLAEASEVSPSSSVSGPSPWIADESLSSVASVKPLRAKTEFEFLSLGSQLRRSSVEFTPQTIASPTAVTASLHGGVGRVPATMPQGVGPLNVKALEITQRIQAKLTGRDFSTPEALTVPQQVQRLIHEATSVENLCTAWLGWAPFW